MRESNREEAQESVTALVLTIALMSILILTVAGGMLWLVQIILSHGTQINEITRSL